MRDVGSTAWDQWAADREKLRRRLTEGLRHSMGSIVGDKTHADLLLISLDGRKLAAHRSILRQRAPGFYRRHIEPTVLAASKGRRLSPGQRLEVAIGDVDFKGLEFFVRSVYTEDEVASLGDRPSNGGKSADDAGDDDGEGGDGQQGTSRQERHQQQHQSEQLPRSSTGGTGASVSAVAGNSGVTTSSTGQYEQRYYVSDVGAYDSGAETTPIGGQTQWTSFRQLACDSPTKSMVGGVCDTFVGGSGSPDSMNGVRPGGGEEMTGDDRKLSNASSSIRPHAADIMTGKFIRLDDVKIEVEIAKSAEVDAQCKKQIFPMFIGLDSPARPATLGHYRSSENYMPSSMSQSFPSPGSETGSISDVAGEPFPPFDEEASCGLAADLLQMLSEERDVDIAVHTLDGTLKAHMCILSATSPFFKAIFESSENFDRQAGVDMKRFTKAVVQFGLQILYGRLTTTPHDMDIWELLNFAHHIESKEIAEVAKLYLKARLCHYFHRPCAACVSAVFDLLPRMHNDTRLADLLEEALSWQAKYFGRIWKGRVFLHLNERWQRVCFSYVVEHMNGDAVLEVLLGCERLQATLPRVRPSAATDLVMQMVVELLDISGAYLSNNFDLVIASRSFAALGKGLALNLGLLEDVLPQVVHTLSCDVGCRALMNLYDLLVLFTQYESDKRGKQAPVTGVHSLDSLIDEWNERFINLVKRLYELVDTHLLHHAASVVQCEEWKQLNPQMQARIQDTGIFVELRQPKAPPPKLSSLSRTYKRSASAGVSLLGGSGSSVYDRARSMERGGGGRPLSMIAQLPPTIEDKESARDSHNGSGDSGGGRKMSDPPIRRRLIAADRELLVAKQSAPVRLIADQGGMKEDNAEHMNSEQVQEDHQIHPRQGVAGVARTATAEEAVPVPPKNETKDDLSGAATNVCPPTAKGASVTRIAEPQTAFTNYSDQPTVEPTDQPVADSSSESQTPRLERQVTRTIIPAPTDAKVTHETAMAEQKQQRHKQQQQQQQQQHQQNVKETPRKSSGVQPSSSATADATDNTEQPQPQKQQQRQQQQVQQQLQQKQQLREPPPPPAQQEKPQQETQRELASQQQQLQELPKQQQQQQQQTSQQPHQQQHHHHQQQQQQIQQQQQQQQQSSQQQQPQQPPQQDQLQKPQKPLQEPQQPQQQRVAPMKVEKPRSVVKPMIQAQPVEVGDKSTVVVPEQQPEPAKAPPPRAVQPSSSSTVDRNVKLTPHAVDKKFVGASNVVRRAVAASQQQQSGVKLVSGPTKSAAITAAAGPKIRPAAATTAKTGSVQSRIDAGRGKPAPAVQPTAPIAPTRTPTANMSTTSTGSKKAVSTTPIVRTPSSATPTNNNNNGNKSKRPLAADPPVPNNTLKVEHGSALKSAKAASKIPRSPKTMRKAEK